MNKNIITASMVMLMVGSFFAGGYRVSLQGVRQAAMAHTSAHVKDASVLFFNPAGMSFIEEKLSVSAGVFFTGLNSEYQDASTFYKYETDNDTSTPIYFGLSYKLKNNVSLGLSVTTPFGNSITWGDDWAGSELVQDISLRAINIQPTVSYQFADWFSAGLGFIYSTGSVNLNRGIELVGGQLNLEDNKASGIGFNVGAYFNFKNNLDLSLAYRSKIDMKVEGGNAKFLVPNSLIGSSTFPVGEDKFDATLPLVSEFTAGLTYQVNDRLIISGDINVHGWQAYRRLTFDFEQTPVSPGEADPTVSTTPKNFKTVNSYRLGGEYTLKNNLALRLGYYYDESPVRSEYFSPETPSTNNYFLTFGAGYEFKNGLSLDAFGSKLFGKVITFDNPYTNFKGQLRNDGFIFGIGLSYNK